MVLIKNHFSKYSEVICTIDGHIFNYKELGEISNKAELIIKLYKQFGFEKTVQKINGDFSIALYDLDKKIIWIARDRFGIKPLYYINNIKRFAFASRISALNILPFSNKTLNEKFLAIYAASHYRYFDNNPNESPYKEIAQLPAAHILCFQNKKISIKPYWTLKDLPDFEESENILSEKYCELFCDTVNIRLKSTNNHAFTLSGGMDSSSVMASARHILNKKLPAFSTIYKDKTYDESDEIKTFLKDNVKKWHPIKINIPDIFLIIKKMIKIHDEPIATATWLSHFLLCDEVSKMGFKSLFGGLGGDELNAGEYEYFFYYFADLLFQGKKDEFNIEVKKWIKYHNHPVFRKSFSVVEDYFKKYINFKQVGRFSADKSRMLRYKSIINKDFFDFDKFKPIMKYPFKSYLKNRTYQDMFYETLPCCLRAEDRQTLNYNLDNIIPFLDFRLVEFMFRIPGKMKIRKGVTKYLLRKSMKGILPEETRTRIKKTGWNAPAHIWFLGKNLDFIKDMVLSKSFRDRGIYNVKNVLKVINDHEKIISSNQIKDNHMMFLWQLVNMELWLRDL